MVVSGEIHLQLKRRMAISSENPCNQQACIGWVGGGEGEGVIHSEEMRGGLRVGGRVALEHSFSGIKMHHDHTFCSWHSATGGLISVCPVSRPPRLRRLKCMRLTCGRGAGPTLLSCPHEGHRCGCTDA
jgi:hypothetical protein